MLQHVHCTDAELYVEITGTGRPVVLVHGSWDDHRSWDRVVPLLSPHCQVVGYDRRGHSKSTRPPGQGSIREDARDLACLISELALDRPLVVGHSYGSCVALLFGAGHPELTSGLVIHEPPLFALLTADESTRHLATTASAEMKIAAELLSQGFLAEGAHHFVEKVGFGPGTWTGLFTEEMRRTCVANADTWLDQYRDPDRLAIRPEILTGFPHPILITYGDAGPPAYKPVVDLLTAELPQAQGRLIPGAGHAPHLSHPARLAEVIVSALGATASPYTGNGLTFPARKPGEGT
ncbi:alpha/beta fold hydrolase [Sinosporangium siamense]|uniref:AB hydrolase-1 domain-containing protein n=1 Tax=Sinosporangium siamense TaxID=1367973 RepID=A0A919RI83_9ACTN|nr:alpha/beta hydrolase [Sinosporangium siamense]GII92319.1 hypothetical protein Ssi02_25500 [Sinosporangium siamense]